MKKKEFLTEAKRKAIIADKEKAILESFAKTFNKIKRIDENEIKESKYDTSNIHPTNPLYGASDEELDNVTSAMQLQKENEEDSVEADLLDKDIVSVNSTVPPYKELGYYKIKTDVDYGISPGEKQTYWHPGDSPNIEDIQVNLEPNAIQLDDNGEEIGVIELPSSHYRAIEDRIIQDIEYGFDNYKDTTYFTAPYQDEDDY